ncbi:MAG: aminotransferase class IV [Flavobacteriaceae bacterium]|nr:aminotransferase class IV [Flavobacteriaceae bacterium]MDZ4147119.1 aminotransferase class IV [Flavobacteriaceae bacterium]
MKLLETIQIRDGKPINIDFHSARFNRSRAELFGTSTALDLSKFIQIPKDCLTGIYRCRLIYERDIEQISFSPYQFRSIKTLKIVQLSDISYDYKWENRKLFNDLLQQNNDVDEIIIAKNGLITDCTFANLAFWNGENWLTPNTPLLKGTKRAELLQNRKIIEAKIDVLDVETYQKVCLINSFRDLDFLAAIGVGTIKTNTL